MVSPYLLRRPRSLDEAAAAHAPDPAAPVDPQARSAILRALRRYRQELPRTAEKPRPEPKADEETPKK